VVAVKVDASQFEGWFYEGAGIYRHVWLVKTAPVAIAPDGIFVYSEFKNNLPGDTTQSPARLHIETRLFNSQTTLRMRMSNMKSLVRKETFSKHDVNAANYSSLIDGI
jgi:beta-galactosidase